MGIVNSLLGGLMGDMGGNKMSVQTPATVQPVEKTASEIAAEEEQKKKAALVALNASGGGNQQTTVGGGNADVTRRALLGL